MLKSHLTHCWQEMCAIHESSKGHASLILVGRWNSILCPRRKATAIACNNHLKCVCVSGKMYASTWIERRSIWHETTLAACQLPHSANASNANNPVHEIGKLCYASVRSATVRSRAAHTRTHFLALTIGLCLIFALILFVHPRHWRPAKLSPHALSMYPKFLKLCSKRRKKTIESMTITTHKKSSRRGAPYFNYSMA